MIQTGLKADKIGEFLKEHLSVLIIVPAFIGGLWQSIELMSISIPYIRFFSLSQIIPDGILILVFFIIGFSTFIFSIILDKVLFSRPRSTDEIETLTIAEIEKKRKNDIIKCCSLFFICYILGLSYFIYFLNIKDSTAGLYSDVSVAVLVCLFCNIFLGVCYELANSFFKEIYKFFNIFLGCLYLLLVLYFCRKIHNTFLLTNNLDNIENIECMLQEKYPASEKEILYFNDKYIFIKIFDKKIIDVETKEPKEKIHIMELENLFNN